MGLSSSLFKYGRAKVDVNVRSAQDRRNRSLLFIKNIYKIESKLWDWQVCGHPQGFIVF